MASQSYPSTAGAGIGSLVYSFEAKPNAEYDTPLLNTYGVYEFRSPEEPVTVSIYEVGNTTVPVKVVRINERDTLTYTGTVTRIKVLTSLNRQSALLISTFSAASNPSRTGSAQDGLGEQYVHTEKSQYVFGYEGYGFERTRYPMTRINTDDTAYVGWTYNSTGTGIYRIRNNPNNTTVGGLLGNFFYKDLSNTTNTWTRLADIPTPPQATADAITYDVTYTTGRLRGAYIYDDGATLYVWFRSVTSLNQTINGTVYANSDTYLYSYTKGTDTWAFIGAYYLGGRDFNSYAEGPQMHFTATISGTKYFYPWQVERSGNGFYRYNLTTGARSVVALAANSWNEGAYVNGYFLASPTQGIGNTDSSATDYQLYDPVANTWTTVPAPTSRVNEAATWQRGGQVFRYSATAFGVIGRRTYTTDNASPSNGDRYWGRRLWIWDTTSQNLDRWTDISSTFGDFYPISMRPGNDTYGSTFIFQPNDTTWNGRFFRFRNNNGGSFLGRYNHDYLDVTKPKDVTAIADARPRGTMAVGGNSVIAYGYARNPQSQPVVYASYGQSVPDSEIVGFDSMSDSTTALNRSYHMSHGCELIYTDGRVYPILSELAITNAVYDPQMRRYYVTGWRASRTEASQTAQSMTALAAWRQTSAIIEEDTGAWYYNDPNFQDQMITTSNPGEIVTYSAGKAYKPGIHFIRPYDSDSWQVFNLWNASNQGQHSRSYRFADYTWRSVNYQGQRSRPGNFYFQHDVKSNQYIQLVKFGQGPITRFGIPDGTIFWDGRCLIQYNAEEGITPFSGTQTGWRRLHITTSPYVTDDSTFAKAPSVWFDGRYAICQKADNTGYYVFDMDNIWAEPKIISSHVPINSRPTPAYQPVNSGTIGNNWWNFYYNSACLGGVEIIAGGAESDGVRTWRNTVYYIVRQK